MIQVNNADVVTVHDLPSIGKFSLRCKPDGQSALSAALRLDLPNQIGSMTQSGTQRILCLGPDEWMLYCQDSDRAVLSAKSEEIYSSVLHSLVDISFREVSLEISGPKAEALLNTSCPRNLKKITLGHGTRTVFDTAQVILTREASDRFHMHVWRSFYPHVRGLLDVAQREFIAGL